MIVSRILLLYGVVSNPRTRNMRVRSKMAGIDESIQLRADDDDEFGVAADGEWHHSTRRMYKTWEVSK